MLMSVVAINKFLHVIASVTLVGINVAIFFYVVQSQRQQCKRLMQYACVVSFYSDLLYVILIGVILVTAVHLQHALSLGMDTDWIKVAHIAFGLTIILWLAQVVIRAISYRQKKLIYRKVYITMSVMMWVLFVLIIRDASTHSTWVTLLGAK